MIIDVPQGQAQAYGLQLLTAHPLYQEQGIESVRLAISLEENKHSELHMQLKSSWPKAVLLERRHLSLSSAASAPSPQLDGIMQQRGVRVS